MIGSVATWANWFFTYPIETSKVKIQNFPSNYRKILFDGGMFDATIETYRQHGLKGYFKGFWIATLLSIWQGGFGFVTYIALFIFI